MIEPVFQPDKRQRLVGCHRIRGDVRHQGDVLARGQAGNQIVELEHEADMRSSVLGEPIAVELIEAQAAVVQGAAGSDVQATEYVEQRRFAAARCAQQHEQLTGANVQIDLA